VAEATSGEGAGAQEAVLRFLENGGLGEPVERIDTHGAQILLGRERAWKMMRAVRFSFMVESNGRCNTMSEGLR
jgi:hypothetical protein